MSENPMQPIDASRTALVFVDPYNDFLSEGGKLWPRLAEVAASVGLHKNLKSIVLAARAAGVQIIIAPHHQAEPNDFEDFCQPTPYQLGAHHLQVFQKGSWGAQWHPDYAPQPDDIIVKEHWTASGFANTDLDYRLKQRRLTHLIIVGLIANTCIEGTARAAVDLGYHVTLVRDATAAFTPQAMHAAHDINAPSYAHAVVTTAEVLARFE
jgi:nicotinamidase-related amidase